MVAINDTHVEWRVVSRLLEMLRRPPEAEHDVTLIYALFTSTLCWTCQRLREKVPGSHRGLWSELNGEIAIKPPWRIGQLMPRMDAPGASGLETLPASQLLVGLRNGVAHGTHRNVLPYHSGGRGADRKLLGFKVVTSFGGKWGSWTLTLSRVEMRIGILISARFVETLDADSQSDARRHVVGA